MDYFWVHKEEMPSGLHRVDVKCLSSNKVYISVTGNSFPAAAVDDPEIEILAHQSPTTSNNSTSAPSCSFCDEQLSESLPVALLVKSEGATLYLLLFLTDQNRAKERNNKRANAQHCTYVC